MFDPKHPDSEESFAFDFTDLLATGETVQSAAVTCSVIHGTDPAASSMVQGTPTVQSPKVSIFIVDGVEGVIYRLKCIATTSNGQDLVLESDLLVSAMPH
jgi:hypothetical protein